MFKMKKIFTTKGQILPVVAVIMLFLLVIVPVLVSWLDNQVRWSRKVQRKSVAFNLAEAGIDRGVWKLKSSTGTWDMAVKGIPIEGYNFDKIYTDVKGGTYRIKFSSGPGTRQVTIIAEGRDDTTNEIRAIKAVYQNQTIPGSIISRGQVYLGNAFECHWGPVMAHGNIELTDAVIAKKYYPRKFSRQVVKSLPSYPRDTNGLDPPNTDNLEWWSDYPVPDLPILNFDALRSSAATNVALYLATSTVQTYDGSVFKKNINDSTYNFWIVQDINAPPPPGWNDKKYQDGTQWFYYVSSWTINTLNVYACSEMTNYNGPKWWYCYRRRVRVTSQKCQVPGESGGNHNGRPHFYNPWRHPLHAKGHVWYWDGDLIMTGGAGDDGCGIIGQLIIRGNFTNYTGDNLYYNEIGLSNCKVPQEAYLEYQKIDTSSIDQYPADDGYKRVRPTFKFGDETWDDGPADYNTDVGLAGFLYVGGNYRMEGAMDIYGAAWVVGTVSRGTGVSEYSIIFFDETLDLPSLNVVLVRKSWQEIVPSSIPW